MSELPEKARKAGFLARRLLKSALRTAGSGAHEMAARKDAVSSAVSEGVGEAARVAAQVLGSAANGLGSAARALDEGRRAQSEEDAAEQAATLAGRGRELGARALQRSSAALDKAAGGVAAARAAGAPLGAAAGGAFASVAGTLGATLDAAALDDSDFATVMQGIAVNAARYAQLSAARAARADCEGSAGGPHAQLPALYVDWLNRGRLPGAFHARLADGGFVVLDGSGAPNEALQRKAEESFAHLQAALVRHPDIVPTDIEELAAELLLRAILEQGRDDRPDLQAVERALAGRGEDGLRDAQPDGGWLTSSAGLAFLALATFSDRSRSLLERSENFGARSAEILLASGAGRLALAAGHVWWIGALAGAGSSLVWGRGRAKRARLDALQALADSTDRVLRRLEN